MPEPSPPPLGPCPACAGELERWRSVPASDPVLDERRYTLARCRRCGSAVTLEPAPEDLHEQGAYGGGRPRLHRLARPVLDAFDAQRLRILRGLVPPPARLLDVGCGRGRFVLSARRAGYDAAGLEPSERGVSAARELGVPVMHADIDAARVDPASLDAATAWHVLEHLDQPGPALRRIWGWLRPGGGLLVGVPNLAGLQARVGLEAWFHLDAPRHRTHFTAAGIELLLQRHGFRIDRTVHVLAEHNPYGMWQSLVSRFTATPSYLYHLLKHNAEPGSPDLLTTTALLPLTPVAAAAEALAGGVRRGGTVAVLAERQVDPGVGE